jgi:outer membrane lipoprotein-sorting protein
VRAGDRRATALVLCCALAVLSACGRKRVELPSGAGTPFPDAGAAYQEAVQDCRGVRSIKATLSLSGRVGSTRLRGDVDAGFEAPEKVRLEGRHPLGRPLFILVATGPQATLLLPRDNRVLRNAATGDIVDALVGLPLGGSDLRALVSGCGFGAADASGGRSYPGGWVTVDGGGATTYLRQIDRRWRVVAATRPPITVHYSTFTLGRPSTVRLQAIAATAADVTVRLSDVNINVALEPAVFELKAPTGVEPLTIDELRRAGPLGGK